MTLTVFGFDKMQAYIESLPEFVQKSADVLMAKGADLMREEAQAIVPVRTGRLQRSVKVVRIESCFYLVGSDVEYAGFVEFGTSRMRAQPFLRPAWDRAHPRALDSVVGLLEQLKAEFLL
jgi:HK97 gp10 family phage protein